MSSAFSLNCFHDVVHNRIEVTASGPIDSRLLADEQLAFLKSLDRPWTLDRLIDLRRGRGVVAYQDLIRLSRWWQSVEVKAPRAIKAAVVSLEEGLNARSRSIDLLFPKQVCRYFTDRDAAEEWLGDARVSESAPSFGAFGDRTVYIDG